MRIKILIIIGCLSVSAYSQINKQNLEELKNYYHQTLTDNNIAGSSIYLLQDGKVILSEFHGESQLNRKQMDDEAIYHWASITKTLTGIGIMQLRDRGFLSLGDLAIDYLPELKKIYDPNGWLNKITIQSLLNHSSGLRGATWPWKSQPWHPHEPQSWDQLVAMFPYSEILFEPGSKWSYSNPGIIVLGRIIEEITAEDFEYYMEKNVLRPLGMLDSYYDKAPPHLLSRVCHSYWYADGSYEPAIFDLNTGITVSNGGLMAPFSDMATYLNFLMGNMPVHQASLVLRRESVEEMFSETIQMDQGVPIDVDYHSMGLCFFMENIYGMKMIGHSGFQNGFHTHMYFSLENNLAYLIGYNSAGPTNRAMDDEIKRYIFKNIFSK